MGAQPDRGRGTRSGPLDALRKLAALGAAAALGLGFAPSTSACELRGTFVGYEFAGTISDIDFVTPVLADAESSCGDARAVMPSPMMEQWVVGTPVLEVGRHYWFLLRAGGSFGTHVVVDARPHQTSSSQNGVTIPSDAGPILKPGNDMPPCTIGFWRPEALPVILEVDSAGSADIDDGSDIEAVRLAAAEWSSPAPSAAAFDIVLRDASVDRGVDGRTTLAFVDEGTEIFDNIGPENLGFTCVVCDDDGYIIEADVRLNGIDRTWTTACNGRDFDVFGAALHELGHVLGFAHTSEPTSVMYPVTSARRLLDARTLSGDDVDAAVSAYPCADGTCGGPSSRDDDCPPGDALCVECDSDDTCGGETDTCVIDRVTGDSFCARECSQSFPCPAGFECVNTGGERMQCVPIDGLCPTPETFVGCECVTDAECGDSDDICLDGRCASACGQGIGCPADSVCTATYDEDGMPNGLLCLPAHDLDPCAPTPLRRGCGRCGSGEGEGGWLGILLLGMTLASRRFVMASRCR